MRRISVKTDGKRVGLIVPSSNSVMEPDFYRHLPARVTLHTARMYLKNVTAEDEARMIDEFTLPAARDLATAEVDVVVFGCTSASALRGNKYEEKLIKEVSKTAKAPCLSVTKAVRGALHGLNVRKAVVVTPYVDELNLKIAASLESDGIEVLRINGLGIVENTRIARVEGNDIIKLAKDAVKGLQPDALFVSCTNFPAMNVLPRLRRAFDFPVITSNQAILDAAIAALS